MLIFDMLSPLCLDGNVHFVLPDAVVKSAARLPQRKNAPRHAGMPMK